jgi:hypothetical protein
MNSQNQKHYPFPKRSNEPGKVRLVSYVGLAVLQLERKLTRRNVKTRRDPGSVASTSAEGFHLDLIRLISGNRKCRIDLASFYMKIHVAKRKTQHDNNKTTTDA